MARMARVEPDVEGKQEGHTPRRKRRPTERYSSKLHEPGLKARRKKQRGRHLHFGGISLEEEKDADHHIICLTTQPAAYNQRRRKREGTRDPVHPSQKEGEQLHGTKTMPKNSPRCRQFAVTLNGTLELG